MKPRIFGQNRNAKFRKSTVSLAIIFCLVLQLGCDRQGAIDLATLGVEAGQTLTAYYESLAKETNDTWDKENLYLALLRRPVPPPAPGAATTGGATVEPAFDEEAIILLTRRVSAINSRIAMAKQMTVMYSVLKDYSSYDAGARVEDAAKKLGGALQALLPFPGGINPTTLMAGVAGDLQRWNQQRKINELTKTCLELMRKLDVLFEKEQDAYTKISQENTVTKTSIAKQLINKEMVLSWQLLDDVPTSFGLKWSTSIVNTPVKDEATKKAFISIIEHRNNVLMGHALNAAENIKAALNNLVAEQEKYINKKSLDIAQIKSFLERARFYVGEIQKLNDSQQQAKEKTNG